MPQKYDDYHLHRLCREGRFEEVYHFLEDNGNRNVDKFDKKGYAPIHYAVKRDTADIEHVLSILFTHDSDVNARSLRDGDTAMHMVVERFNEEDATSLCLTLLSHGADPDYRNDKYRTPFDIAMAREMLHLADFLSEDITQDDAKQKVQQYRKQHYGKVGNWLVKIQVKLKLIKSVMVGNMDGILASLQQGGDPGIMNEHGAAAIHYTITHCTTNKVAVLGHLLSAGAEVNLQDYEGDTALNLVIKTCQQRSYRENQLLVQILLDNGADPSIKDLDGKNCLYLAQNRGYGDILSLLENGYMVEPKRPEDTPVRAPPPPHEKTGRPKRKTGEDDKKRKDPDPIEPDPKEPDSIKPDPIKEVKKDEEDKKNTKKCVIL